MVLGAGNRYRRDDGAGIAAAERLRGRVPAAVRTGEGDLASALDAWEGVDALVVIDATSSGAPPGTVRRIEAHAQPLPAAFSRTSTHAFGVAEAIELARTLGKLPARVVVYGIEGSDFGPGEGLTPEVAASVEAVVAQVSREANVRG